MIKISDLKGIFNITQNPDHKDWLDLSFKEDFCIPEPYTDFCITNCLKIELDNEYEEVFIEGAYQNNIDYDIHFGTIIADDKERVLNMYYSFKDSSEETFWIDAGVIHTHLYLAFKNKNINSVKYDNLLIIDDNKIIEGIETQTELPSNDKFIRIKVNG